ncbi:glycosyltransferase [bacterium]|nr:glycosyltransferase [bacterium]
MRIGICTFGGDGGKSGISRYIINVLAEMAQLDQSHEIDLMLYEDERDVFLPKAGRPMNPLTFPTSLRPPIRNILWHQASLPGLCRRNRYGVLFLPAANRRATISLPCPSVGTVHDFSSIHVTGKYDPARIFYIRTVLPFLVRRLSHVLTVSESSRRDIIEFAGVPPDRVTVTPLAADHRVYFPDDRDKARAHIKARYKIDGPYILYTSRLEHPGKNHVRLIEAFNQMKSASGLPHKLVLAGSDWSGAEAVHASAEKSPYRADIVFPGFVASADLPALYRGADLFVFPSLYEGFGLPILEAMACGVATACSNLSSMPEVAGDAAPTFDPYQPEAIRDVLLRLLDDESHRAECERRCIARAAEFNWARTAATTLSVLETAAK